MRILFCTHYFPPEVNAPASRTFEHCRAWARAGHKVTVLTCAPNHPNGRLYPGYRNSLFQRQTMDGIEIVRVWTFLAANDGFLLRILNYLSFFVSACIAIAILPKPDIFISTSPQFFCGLTGLFARRVRGFLWLLEIRDLWPESIVAVGAMRRGPLIRLLEWLEVYAYRQADHIVPVTDSFVKHIAERCKDLDKITVVKNGVNLDMFKSDAAAAMELRKALGLEGKFVAAYIGTHGKAHGLETLLAAAERLRDDTEIAFLMVGDGAERERLLKLADERRLKNIHIIGQRPRSEMAAIWGAADASLILLRRKEAFKKVIPSKMFEAMAMARPIILGVEGEAQALLAGAQAGIAITPEDPDQLAAAIRELARNRRLARRMGEQGASYVREHFDREKLAGRFLGLLKAMVLRNLRGKAPAIEDRLVPQ